MYENRSVAVADVKGARSNAEFHEFLLIKLENEQVDMMCNMDGKHRKHVATEAGKIVLCLVLSDAFCGCTQRTLLWHNMLSSSYLIDVGFTLNPHDSCVANKVVNSLNSQLHDM